MAEVGSRCCLKREHGSSRATVAAQGVFSARQGARGRPAGRITGDIPPPAKYQARQVWTRPDTCRPIQRDRRLPANRACKPAVCARNATTTASTAVGNSGPSLSMIDEGSLPATVLLAGVLGDGPEDLCRDRRARGLMTPRQDVEIAGVHETRAEILARFQASRHSRLPLRHGGPADIVRVLHSRDLLATGDAEFDALALVRPAPAIQETLPALEVIDRLRRSPCHMVLVYDGHGHFEEIVTPMDVLGTIAGGFDEAEMDEPKFVRGGDGSQGGCRSKNSRSNSALHPATMKA